MLSRAVFDTFQPQGSMSVDNLRNTLRGLFMLDLMPLRPRASIALDNMEYSTDASAAAKWSGTGVTVTKSNTAQIGSYSVQALTDGTADRSVSQTIALNLSGYKSITLWHRANIASSAIQFFLQDGSANQSRWNITTNGTANTWVQITLTLASPDSNSGTPADLTNIASIGFRLLDASTTYLFDQIKAICALNVAIEGTQSGSFYNNVYSGSQPIATGDQASPNIGVPTANPRIDILYMRPSGDLQWASGTEAGSPTLPWSKVSGDYIPICAVYCKTTMTKVVDYEDKDLDTNQGYIYQDVRPFLNLGRTDFLGLRDTPASYSGQSGKSVTVASGESSLEFTDGLPNGSVVQVVNTQSGAVATGTTVMPLDDTIPQNTEGDEWMTRSITPKATTNKLKIDVVWSGTNSASVVIVMALFQDNIANALAAVNQTLKAAGDMNIVSFTHFMTAGTTSATTFKIRAGAASGTTTFNGINGVRQLGGVMASSITITEIKA